MAVYTFPDWLNVSIQVNKVNHTAKLQSGWLLPVMRTWLINQLKPLDKSAVNVSKLLEAESADTVPQSLDNLIGVCLTTKLDETVLKDVEAETRNIDKYYALRRKYLDLKPSTRIKALAWLTQQMAQPGIDALHMRWYVESMLFYTPEDRYSGCILTPFLGLNEGQITKLFEAKEQKDETGLVTDGTEVFRESTILPDDDSFFSLPIKTVCDRLIQIQSQWQEDKPPPKKKGRVANKGVHWGEEERHSISAYSATYCSSIRPSSLRLTLAVAAMKEWHIKQCRIINRGYAIPTALIDRGFGYSSVEPCLLYRADCCIAISDNEMLLLGEEAATTEVIKSLSATFQLEESDSPRLFLGMNIVEEADGFAISVCDTLSKLASHFKVELPKKPIVQPLSASTQLDKTASKELEEEDKKLFESLLMVLQFLAATVRYDLAYSARRLSQYKARPREAHLNAAKKALKYAIQTKRFAIHYRKRQIQDLHVSVACDSDRSASPLAYFGYMVFFNSNLIYWKSDRRTKDLKCDSRCEFLTYTDAFNGANAIRELVENLGLESKSVLLYNDNWSALQLAANGHFHKKVWDFDEYYKGIVDAVQGKEVRLFHIISGDNLATILIKPLKLANFNKRVNQIDGM